jgi:hypothetical protein
METIIHFIIFLTAVIEIVLLVRFFTLCQTYSGHRTVFI